MRGTPAVYFKSLNRHFKVMGVDRQLFFLFVSICLPIAFSARLSLMMDGIAVGIFIVLCAAGVLLTRVDEQVLGVFRRHIHYKKYYAANAGIHATLPVIKASVPFYQGKRGLV